MSTSLATPRLDRATIFRLTIEDFPLSESELVLLDDRSERFRLEECFRAAVDVGAAALAAAELWRVGAGGEA